MYQSCRFLPVCQFLLFSFALIPAAFAQSTATGTFRAGAAVHDITPTKFPSPVNGGMKGAFTDKVHDPMHARSICLHDGKRGLVLVVVDSCMIPREICEEAKALAAKETGIATSHILISATHTHSAATMTAVFQSDPDPEYVKTVPAGIAAAITKSYKNLEPAELGWAFGSDPANVFNRRWYLKDGMTHENPFGQLTDRARMNPGVGSPAVSVPTGPVDADVAVLAVRSAADQRPLGLLANYSLHYVGGYPAISADYFGVFADAMTMLLQANDKRYESKPQFVGIMSNGTSGNINNVNFGASSALKRDGDRIELVARSVANAAKSAFDAIPWRKDVTLDSAETDLQLGVRKPSPADLATAKHIVETLPRDKDGQFREPKGIYALETIKLADYPATVPVKLQVHRINDLTIAAIPCETFVETGLRLKRTAPFRRHFTVSLANGYNGYLPTVEHHALGGYETWRARSSYLAVDAEAKVVDSLEQMLRDLKSRAPATATK